MSIQSSVNQGISIFSMLLSQTPAAEKRRVEKAVEARAPEREADLKQAQAKADIAIAEAKSKTEDRLKLTEESKKKKLEDDIIRQTGIHKTHAAAVADLPRTKSKEQLSATQADLATYPGHLASRKAAIQSGEKLNKIAPSQELADNLAKWNKEIEEIKAFQADLETKKQIKQEADELRKKRERALRRAENAKKLEQERLARTPKTEDTK